MKQPKERRWQDIISNWERSVTSQKKFCKAERLAVSTFRYWKKRLEESGEVSKFVRVVAEEKPRREISITFDAGIRMIIPDTIPNEALSRMILAVSEALCVSTGTR